jgi:transmembrane sensor
MSAAGDALSPDHAVLEAAAEWYALLSSGHAGAQEQAAWQAWLASSAAHRAAWQRVEAVSQQFQPVTLGRAERAASLAGLEAAVSRRRQRRTVLRSFVWTGAAVALAWSGAQTEPGRRVLAGVRADHATGVGGFLALTLEDGTRIWLNTDTALQVDYRSTVRQLVLLRGEVSITTASDAARPFVVRTPEGRFQALGTRFNVLTAANETSLSVFEGMVRARFAHAGAIDHATPHDVAAGMHMRGGLQGVSPISALPAQAGAWTRRILQVEEAPLATVIAQLARYRPGHLACAETVAGLSVTGTFPLDDIDRALHMLTLALPVRVRSPLPWWTTIQAR